MGQLMKKLKKFDLIWIILATYVLIKILFFLPIDNFLYNLGIISNTMITDYFVEFIMELLIVFICFSIFFISIYNYSIVKSKDNLFIAVGFLFAGIFNLGHTILSFHGFLNYGSSSELFSIYNRLIVAVVLLLILAFEKIRKNEGYYFWAIVLTSLIFIVSLFTIMNNLWVDWNMIANIVGIVVIEILALNILLYLQEYFTTNNPPYLILLKGLIFLFIAELFYINEVEIFSIGYFMSQAIKLIGYIYIFKSNFIRKLMAGISAQNQLELKNTKLKLHQNRINDLRAQRHDFKNELQTIFTMLQLGKSEKARDYISKLHLDLEDTAYKAHLDHELAPVLISKKQEAQAESIKFYTDINTDLKDVIIPENKVLKILFNLIDNAIDAMKEISAEEKWINVKLFDKQEYVKLIVHNSKPIVSDEILDNVFSPGFSTKGTDRGFGLYIVKSLLTDYGGDIKAKSEEGAGTKFICYLPKKS
ncbi:MAG: sensor histidine kinase [Bacillota bacterium]